MLLCHEEDTGEGTCHHLHYGSAAVLLVQIIVYLVVVRGTFLFVDSASKCMVLDMIPA